MIRNYLLIALRNLLKNKVFSFINICGLGVGMAAFLLIVHYIRFEKSYEDFHRQADNIYRVTYNLYRGDEYVVTDCETHAPLGNLLKEKTREVTDYVRFFDTDNHLSVESNGEKFLESNIYFTDQSVFNIFSLHVLHGKTDNALTHPFQVVLTESLARKYFNRVDVAGESLQINRQTYHITAVVRDVPPNTHLKFTMLLSHPTLEQTRPWYKEDSWGGNNEYTYLLMEPGTDLASFNQKLLALSLSLKDKINDGRFGAEPIKDIHLYSDKTFEPDVNGSAKIVGFLAIIALFIIVIAWVNYINLSTARAVERGREVGVRKVMGSMRIQLVWQFLSEAVLVNAIAALLAITFLQVSLPFFRALTGQPLSMNFGQDHNFWYLFGGLYIAGVLLSGVYPAFVLSSFQPVAVLKGKFKSSTHGQFLRKGLVVFQFAATVLLIIGMCAVYLQIQYMQNLDLGMDISRTLAIRAPQQNNDSTARPAYQSFKNALLSYPQIKNVARSESMPGSSLSELNTTRISRLGQKNELNGGYEYYYYTIDDSFIPAMDMKIVAGKNFKADAPNRRQVIINEEAVQMLGFDNAEQAIGSPITFGGANVNDPTTIVGVLRNFYHRSPKENHLPMLFEYSQDYNQYYTVRLEGDNIHETMSAIEGTWDKVFPQSVFDYFFVDDQYQKQFQNESRFAKVIGTFSVLAIFIACLGLFGLSSYTIQQRTKEIGIRKVLGASVPQIVNLLTHDFLKIVLLAAVLALPLAYLIIREWLSHYVMRFTLNAWIFALPVVLILLIALITVSVQTIRTALDNPVNSLKQE